MAEFWLALDQGGHASRALVFSASGEVAAQASVAISTHNVPHGHVEHDPDEVVGSLRKAIDDASVQLPARSTIRAAGLATQRSSMVCWSRRTGRALSPVISWQDRRNASWLERLADKGDRIRKLTGLRATPHYGASKMRWCLDHLPAVAAAAAAGDLVMGPLASFLLHRLLNERPLVADPANASRTQLWALATRDWSPELLALFGIDARVLPEAVPSTYAYGTLGTRRCPVPLTVTTGDQSAVPFAFGPLDSGIAYVNLGTGAFIQRPVSGAPPEAPRLLVSVVWSDAARVDYLLEGTVNGAGSALAWLAEHEGVDLRTLLAEAEQSLASGETPPLFINGVSGLGSPYWISNLESRFIGTGSRGARVLSVLESIVFLLKDNLDAMAGHGPPLAGLVVTGGLSANDYLRQCLGSLAQLPVRHAHDPEATARGLARLLAGADAAKWPVEMTEPEVPIAIDGLASRHARWLDEMKRGRA